MCCPEEIVASVTAVAIGLSRELSAENAGLLAAVFTQLGDTLATLSVAKAICEARSAAAAPEKPAEDKAQQDESPQNE